MSTENVGAMLRDDDAQRRSEAARALGSARTEKKIAAARATAESRKGSTWTPEQKAKLKEAQRLRREREKQARIEAGEEPQEAAEKKPVGRPRKPQTEPPPDAVIEGKRGRGRPKKSDAS